MDITQRKPNGYYFYCPNCGETFIAYTLPRGTVPNIRDGFGIPINHYECSKCHNLDAGFMSIRKGGAEEQRYYEFVIRHYQDIRGINTNKR